MNKTATLYEVYPKRALHEPIDTLPLMDRDTVKKKAVASARKWGGVVVQVRARILKRHPLVREVISSEIVFVHKPKRTGNDERDKITRKQLMGKLRGNSKSLYRGFRR